MPGASRGSAGRPTATSGDRWPYTWQFFCSERAEPDSWPDLNQIVTNRPTGRAPGLMAGSAPLYRGQVGYQLALRAVLAEPDHHDSAGLHPGDHALAEAGMDDVLPHPEGHRR